MKKLALSLIVMCMGIITYPQESESVFPISKRFTNFNPQKDGSVFPISTRILDPHESRLVDMPQLSHGPLFTDIPQHQVEIGGVVPNIPFKLMNGATVNLYDFKDKLVILDFWATWCGTCIAKFPEIDSLQQRYKDQLQVLLVNSFPTGDSQKKVSDFFNKRKNTFGNSTEAMVTVDDTIAQQVFPHRSLPHYAWITKDHRLKAITFKDQVNKTNIEAVLNGESVVFPIKKDFSVDELINFPSTIDSRLAVFKVFRRGKLDGVSTSLDSREEQISEGNKTTSIPRGRVMVNATLLEMYNLTLLGNTKFLAKYTNKYLILDVKDSSELVFNPATMNREEWEQENFYYYDVVLPPKETENIYSLILEDLNYYSGYYGRIEKRKIKCWALVATGNLNKIKREISEDNSNLNYFKGIAFSDFVKMMDYRVKNTNLPILNKTRYKGLINIALSKEIEDIATLKEELKQYNLDLIEIEKVLKVFVISKK